MQIPASSLDANFWKDFIQRNICILSTFGRRFQICKIRRQGVIQGTMGLMYESWVLGASTPFGLQPFPWSVLHWIQLNSIDQLVRALLEYLFWILGKIIFSVVFFRFSFLIFIRIVLLHAVKAHATLFSFTALATKIFVALIDINVIKISLMDCTEDITPLRYMHMRGSYIEGRRKRINNKKKIQLRRKYMTSCTQSLSTDQDVFDNDSKKREINKWKYKTTGKELSSVMVRLEISLAWFDWEP